MKKITDFIVNKRNAILILFVILTGVSLYISKNVSINSDITKYLPSTSETKIGKDIMDKEFEEQKSSSLNVMFKNLTNEEKESTLKSLENTQGVSSVDYDDTEEYNKDEYTLYVLNVEDYDDSSTAKQVYETINENYNVEAMSGSIYNENKPVLQFWIVGVAITMAMVILIILSESYIEPFLYLISIGIAVFINKGTNIIFPSVSNITDSITAILQLALSMDYSIMLSNRYRQEKEKEKNKVKAMKNALYESFKAISSSSITTVVGLLALVFMSFTIGRDLGFVLAKGVFFSLVSIFFCLPSLLLLCDNLIAKTHKKSPHFNFTKMGQFIYKTRWLQLGLIILAFLGSFLLKGNLNILYTDSEQDEVGKVFPATNQIAIVYENKYEDIISEYCHSIKDIDKTNQVLCYGNTINERLAYNELNNKFKELGQNTEIDENLLKIIYYNYYNKDINNRMTFDEFVTFIKSDIYKNELVSDSIDEDMKENINLLENFTNSNNINKKRSAKEIASLLGINENDLNSLFILYNSKNNDTKLTLKQFIDFLYKDVLIDETYAKSINNDMKSSLEQLKTFTNKSIINKKMNTKEIANLFGIDESLVSGLFLFYNTTQDSHTTMTLNEFTNFTLNYVATNESYKNMFNSEQLNSIKMLQTLSDAKVVNNKLSNSEMQNLLSTLGFSKDIVDSLYKFYAVTSESNEKLSLNEFAQIALSLTNNQTEINSLNQIISLTTYYNTKLPASNLYSMFGSNNLTESTISNIVTNYGTNGTMTPQEFVIVLLNSGMITDTTDLTALSMAKTIMDNANNSFDYKMMSSITGMSEDVTKQIYGLNDYNSNLIKLSVKELIEFVIINKENALIKDQIIPYIDTLNTAYFITNNVNTKYNYTELSSVVAIDANTLKNIYSLYDYANNTITMSPLDFVNLILNNKNNALLSDKLTESMLSKLNLVNKVMTSTLNNTSYNVDTMSNLLGIDKETLSLLFGLYDSKYINTNKKISLKNFTNFMISDVISNPKYNTSLDEMSIKKLNTINSVMNNSLKGVKYNSKELYEVLSNLTDKLDKTIVDLVYIYHGSKNNYNDSWKLTVEEIVEYLNNEIVNDERFESFIDKEMKEKIGKAKDAITTAKKLLVSDKYSRTILNTKFAYENEETFDFIKNTLKQVGKQDGIYVIGDSPMALEINKTFDSEMDYITILTMLFIFVVVAITFKSLLIPLILVLIIQCAVYVTMATLTLTNTGVYFISLLIVQAILMGATIDYAIVYTTYYKELRESMNVKDAIINAYNKSIHTILSSSSILIIVTLIVASLASAIAAKICETISAGTFCSVILILFILPGVLAVFDPIICKKNKKN